MARSSKQRNVEPKSTRSDISLLKSNSEIKSKSKYVASDALDNHKTVKPAVNLKPVQLPGCLTCRQRHMKCSRSQPVCQQCIKSKYICYWKKEGTKFSDYDIVLTTVPKPEGRILDPVRNSKKDKYEKKLLMKNKELANSINEISLMSNDPEVMMIHDAVSVFSERIKDIEPGLNIVDNVEVLSNDTNKINSNHVDVEEHHKSQCDLGSNRTSADNELMKYKGRVYYSSQSLFEYPISEIEEEKKQVEIEYEQTGLEHSLVETEVKVDSNKGEQLELCKLEKQDNSWSSFASQASSPNAPPIQLLLEFQNRVKELETSVHASQSTTEPIGLQIDWYTNSIFHNSPSIDKEDLSNHLEKDVSAALAIANILETRLMDNTNKETCLSEAIQPVNQDANCSLSETIEPQQTNQRHLVIGMQKKKSRKACKTEPRDMTTLTIPDIHDMKKRIKRLSETLAKANTEISKDTKRDGRRYRYSNGLKPVDVTKLPLSITKFMRT